MTHRDGHAPETAHNELLHQVRMEITPLLDGLTHTLHDTQAVLPGMQWTIPFHISCGMKGRLIIQVDSLGDCPAHPNPFGEQALEDRYESLLREILMNEVS